MRNRRISWGNVLLNFLVALLIGCLTGPAFGASPLAVAAPVFAGGVVLSYTNLLPKTSLFMAVQQQVWVEDIAGNIYPENSFYLKSIDDSARLQGNVVNLPQAGSAPTAEVNRTTLPAAASKRTDTVKTYNVDEITTDPSIIQLTEAEEVSYDKRADVLIDHVDTLRTKVAEQLAYRWAPSTAGQILRTTGDLHAAYLASQAGSRRIAQFKDIMNVGKLFNKQGVPTDGRVMLVDADFYNDLAMFPEFKDAQNLIAGVLTTGAVGRIAGFDVMMRSSVVTYTNAGTPVANAPGAAAAATDNLSALFWHPRFVRRALGNGSNGGIQPFDSQGNPLYYGDVLSALVRVGGTQRYTNQRGVAALVEAAS